MKREYPVSLLLEGPLFRDELETQPQYFSRMHDVDRLRLVPSKSAANGVYTVYFVPDHRQWALVRLANRYRGLFEIQLQRGMSGEHQLLGQGFTSADIDFLRDILPRPPKQCSPVVYDMLWLVATYDEYLHLAESILARETFVPRDVLRSTDGVSADDGGFFVRFHRSHFIRRSRSDAEPVGRRSDSERSDISVDLDEKFETTDDGEEALEDLLAEHDRIFERRAFDPLLTNPERDPRRHIREYEADAEGSVASVSVESDGESDLGDVAGSFGPPEESLPSDGSPSERDTDEASDGEFTRDEVIEAAVAAARFVVDGSLVRTSEVKTEAWEAAELGDRDRGALWTAVRDVLLAMDGIHGRESGYVWTSSKSEGGPSSSSNSGGGSSGETD